MAITVTDQVPYGNVCDVEIIETADHCEVKFAASPHGGPESLWFCFRIKCTDAAESCQTLILTLKHLRTMLGCPADRAMVPVKRVDGDQWTRMQPAIPTSRSDGRITVSWEVPVPEKTLDVAFCYPYGRPELKELVADTGAYWHETVIGLTQGDRPIIRLSNDHALSNAQRPALLFTARQHSGETPGSWVLDAVLRAIARRDPEVAVWAVPLTNLDGIEQGDYGKDNFPYDLNRAWTRPAMRHETLVMQRDIQWLSERCRPALGIDFHAPGGTEAVGAYTFVPSAQRSPDAHRVVPKWTERVAEKLGEYAADEFARIVTYASRWETPSFSIYCAENLGIAGLTLETPYGMVGSRVLERTDYREIGELIADVIIEHQDEL